MQFDLIDYHRDISDNELIADVQVTATKLGKNTLTGAEYSKHGTYNLSTLTRRFGSWKQVLELCSLDTQGHNFKLQFTDDDIIEDLLRVASLLNKRTLSIKEYNSYGKYYSNTLIRYYGSWNSVLLLAGMEINSNRNIADEEMFEEIERIWVQLGRQPTTTDIKNGISKFSLNTYTRRFGGWRRALQSFIEYINSDTSGTSTSTSHMKDNTLKINHSGHHKTSRDINLRLRYRVMLRDNFKCCLCGATPATDPSVQLHIDHIKPWSKGGETEFENLQTLCNKCNLGKSNLE